MLDLKGGIRQACAIIEIVTTNFNRKYERKKF